MKKLYKYILLIAFTVLGYNCQEDVVDNISGGFIQLANDSSLSIAENSPDNVISLEIILGQEQSSDVTVNFDVTGDSSRFSITPSGGSITIPQGESSATLDITVINNFNTDGDADIVITLLPSSDLPIGIGGENVASVSKTITIVDDDCPLTINDWVGTYSVEEVITGGPNTGLALATAFGEFYSLDLALQPGDVTGTKLVVTNLGNEFLPNGTVITLLSCSSSISLEPSPVVVALFTDFTATSSTYTESNFVITVDGDLGATRQYQFVLTKM